jgi:hypothetical protein
VAGAKAQANGFALGERIGAVSHLPDVLDVFATDYFGTAYWAGWGLNQNGYVDRVWHGWNNIANADAAFGTISSYIGGPVTAVSPSPGRADLFTVATDNHVYRAFTSLPPANLVWTRTGDVSPGPGCYVSAVSRSIYNDDIFVAGSDGQVWAMSFHNVAYPAVVPEPNGWSPLPGIRVGSNTQVAAAYPLPINSLFSLSTLMGTFKHHSGPRILEDGLHGGK